MKYDQNTKIGLGKSKSAQNKGFRPFRCVPVVFMAVFFWATSGLLATPPFTIKSTPAQNPQAPKQVLQPGDILFTDSEAAVLRFDPLTGEFYPLAAGAPLVRPCGIALGPKQTIYVTDTGSLAVLAIRPDAKEIRIVAQGGELGVPYGIAVSAQGNIFVANSQAVLEIDPDEGTSRIISKGGDLRAPLALALTPEGHLYVADALGLLIRIDPTDGHQTVVGTGEHLINPVGVAVQDEQNIFVSDAGAGRIVHVNPRTEMVTPIHGEGNLVSPFGIALIGQHGLIVGDPDACGLDSAVIGIDLRTEKEGLIAVGKDQLVNFRCVAVVPGRPNW